MLIQTLTNEQANGTAVTRAQGAGSNGTIGTGTCRTRAYTVTSDVAAWSAIARKSMLVPAFHDRWPLRTST